MSGGTKFKVTVFMPRELVDRIDRLRRSTVPSTTRAEFIRIACEKYTEDGLSAPCYCSPPDNPVDKDCPVHGYRFERKI